jgi:MFS family permease
MILRAGRSSLAFVSRRCPHDVRLLAKGLSGVSQPFSTISDKPEAEEKKSKGIVERLWGKESNVASPNFKSRWAMIVPALMTHVCIGNYCYFISSCNYLLNRFTGSPYAWSLMADVITREYGFVAPAAADWTLMQSSLALSIVFAFHGISASMLGKWQLKVGPRKSMACAALAFGGALSLGSLGIYLHNLPLIYLGYGALGGIGVGLGYTPPVQSLLQWFPDKKGIASGIAIAGFGSGALLFTPAVQYLTKKFAKMPEYLGSAEDFMTKTIDGKFFADVDGVMVEVVQAGASELSKIPYSSLQEGLYVVGSGSTGAMEALGTIGAAYFLSMFASSLLMKDPHPSFTSSIVSTTSGPSGTAVVPLRDFSVEEATRTKQFALMGATFFCLATGGMGMLSVAKPMMSEVFSAALPAVVTSAFATQFILMLAAGNLGGRLGWAAISDAIGRRKTFMIFTLGSIPVYFSLPYLVEGVVSTGSALPLYLFCAGTAAAVSGMGGAFALFPAYEADLFGTKNIAAIHGRLLLFSSTAGLVGPYMLLKMRSIAEKAAIDDLLSKVSNPVFSFLCID